MRGPRGLIHGDVRPLSVVGVRVYGFVGSDVGVAEKVPRRNDDITECRDIVNGPQVFLSPLGIVRRFAKVNGGKQKKDKRRAYSGAISGFRFPYSPTRSRSVSRKDPNPLAGYWKKKKEDGDERKDAASIAISRQGHTRSSGRAR